MKMVEMSEGGHLWVEADGTVTFISRYGLLENARNNSPQITFNDQGTSGQLADSSPAIKSSRDLLRNMASYARTGGTAQTAADGTSRVARWRPPGERHRPRQ